MTKLHKTRKTHWRQETMQTRHSLLISTTTNTLKPCRPVIRFISPLWPTLSNHADPSFASYLHYDQHSQTTQTRHSLLISTMTNTLKPCRPVIRFLSPLWPTLSNHANPSFASYLHYDQHSQKMQTRHSLHISTVTNTLKPCRPVIRFLSPLWPTLSKKLCVTAIYNYYGICTDWMLYEPGILRSCV